MLDREDGSIYLKRWHLIPHNRFFNIYLHQFLASDEDRALHDHPWWFASLILKGGYWEHRQDGWITWRGPGSFAIRPVKTAHRVELDFKLVQHCDTQELREIPAWTIVFTGPKVRSWGFYCPQGWIHWKRFDSQNGCGER